VQDAGSPNVTRAALPSKSSTGSRVAEWISATSPCYLLPAGTSLFTQGALSHHAFFLDDGWVTLLRTESTGTRVILDLRGPGALVGLAAALADRGHATTAIARTPVHVRPVGGTALRQAAASDIHLTQDLIERLSLESEAYAERCGAVGGLDARAHLLFVLRKFAPGPEHARIRIPLSIRELAGILAIDDSYARRLIRELESQGLLARVNGWIELTDPERLRAL
jgi:CRP/FNR family transcriptional regulator, cyclic AMP receptor protein